MESSRTRLDRYLKQSRQLSTRETKLLIAQNRVKLDSKVASSGQQIVHQFTHVELEGKTLQKHKAIYIALNKPIGVVCATKDDAQRTVVDLIEHPIADKLHIAGRLDKNSSGLVLLTNDGTWSRGLSLPENKVKKTYQVTLGKPLTEEMVKAFETGIYFETEKATTLPASLTITGSYSATVVLSEGKYHQIKRMFGRFRNPVLSIHRVQIGSLQLDDSLPSRSWKFLTEDELNALAVPHHATFP